MVSLEIGEYNQPGSSLPSGQSQESSFTWSHGISFDLSRHFHVRVAEGAYFGSRSGETPKVFATG